jgi:hypothetical protein
MLSALALKDGMLNICILWSEITSTTLFEVIPFPSLRRSRSQ